MAGFQIKVRNLETDETLIATLDSYADAATFLRERPPMMEVLGVLSDVSPAEMRELKEAMRPYDDAEKGMMANRANDLAEAFRKQREADEKLMAEAEKKAREDAKTADPNRPMKIEWEMDDGFSKGDKYDDREISDTIRKAVTAWVQERNTWVQDRGQTVGAASVEVWPNDVPDGDESERVLRGGTFVPRLKDGEVN